MSEADYELGRKTGIAVILGECVRQLGITDLEADNARWVLERQATVAALRLACEDHGDNDWPDDLHLADVVEKHLVRHLD